MNEIAFGAEFADEFVAPVVTPRSHARCRSSRVISWTNDVRLTTFSRLGRKDFGH